MNVSGQHEPPVSVYHMLAWCPKKPERALAPQNWSYRQLWATLWVLGAENSPSYCFLKFFVSKMGQYALQTSSLTLFSALLLVKNSGKLIQVWRCMPVIQEFGRRRYEDQEVKSSFFYVVSSKPAWATWNFFFKKNLDSFFSMAGKVSLSIYTTL